MSTFRQNKNRAEMASANPPSNPNTKPSKIEYPVGGIPVQFPYQPYGSQLAFMGRVISTLDRAQRDGHCHALLESPTGTGKSLSLLCSSLAWQQNYKAKNQCANLTLSKPAPEAFTDPLAHGGGFVPEMEPSGNLPSETLGPAQSTANSTSPKKKTIPTIFYATRTHSQISQVIREYRKTAYRVPMAILASRKHYCTNARVRGKENIDEECKLLLKDRDAGCLHFKNANKVKGHPSLQKGGCHEAHDIEDLVKVGQAVKGCSYYAARSMADHAQLVFCPYSYIINPIIRGAMEVDIKGAILILDEAHNIEDIARDAGSVDVEEDNLLKLQTELEHLCNVNALVYQPLYEMIQDLLSWIQRKKPSLEKREFQHYCSCWTGDKAIRELQEANISQQCFPVLLECVTKAIRAATDTESEEAHIGGMSVILLEGLFSSLTYFFSRNGSHIFDYQLALRRYVKKDAGSSVGNLIHTLSLWCLNPAVVFRDIAELSLSIILTSGTLSPMNSFSSELGVQFGTCLEAPHVIDADSQVWATIMTTGAGNYPMNASFKTADGYGFQDALGKSLEDICNIVPGGALVFFPSYKLMDKLSNRWRETGQWSRLNARKPLFVEPRGSQDDFEHVLKDYYDTIYNRPTVGKKRRVKKLKVNQFNAIESPEDSKREGAAFLAVCRGKVSEGIDFSDDNARVVIVVGIPYPNMYDIQVELKKKYNDTYKSSKNLLSGNEWYCYQAFRALNQAAGRCIRHKFDYGAIILLDERYQYERNRAYISKWLRKCFKQYDNFGMSLEGLRSFFKDVKERVSNNTMTASHKSEIKEDNIPFMDDCKGLTGKNEKPKKSGCRGQKLVSTVDATFPWVNSQKDTKDQTSVQLDVDTKSCIEVIDLECSSPKYSRCSEAVSTSLSREDPEISIVNETPDMDCSITTPSPGSFSRDGNSCSTVFQTSEFPKQVACCSISSTNPSKVPSRDQCSMTFTPEKNVNAVLAPDKESPLNVSVNSHFQKRRKSIARDRQLDAPDADTPGCISFVQSEMAARDANRRIEFGFEINCAEHEFKKSSLARLTTISNCTASFASCVPAVDKRLQIACSLCRSPLGLPENHLYVTCSLTTSSKVHLVSLLRDRLGPHAMNTSTGVSVVMTDVSSVDQRLCNGIREGAQGQGIWCEADGCVFSNIFCPFCSTPDNCLGVQIKATDSSNVQLLNKILFCSEFLEIKNPEVSNDKISSEKNIEARNNKPASDKDLSPVSAPTPSMDKIAAFNSIDKFSYSPQQEVSRGWRTTKSKLRLPKRALLSDVEG